MESSVNKARNLRKTETEAEQRAWSLLRSRKFLGLKFRRQHAIEKYLLDFYCFEHRIAVELDGSVHSRPSQTGRDRAEDGYLKRLGIEVLRVPNGLVLRDPEGFLKKIREALPSLVRLRRTPSPQGEGKGEE